MKKNMIKIGCLALLGLSMAACSEEVLENYVVEPVAKKGITFEAKNFVNEEGTRAEYTFGDEVTLAFNSEDVIGVWGMRDGIKEQVSFHVSEAATDGMSATFDGGLWRLREDGTKYAAVYPYNQYTSEDENGQYINVNYSWSYFDGADPVYSSLSSQDYMVSNAVSAEEGNASFTLEHLGAIVRVRLTGLPANADVNNLTITSESNDFVSQGKVYIGETMSGISIADPEYDMTNQIYINCDNVVSDASGEAIIYFMCAPTNLTGKTVTFFANVNGINYNCEKTGITTIQAGHLKQLRADMTPDMTGMQQLEIGENTIDTDASGYYFVPTTTGLYSNEYANFNGASSVWYESQSYFVLTAGQTYTISYIPEATITISLKEAITLKTLSVGSTTEVETDSWYELSTAEGGFYNITCENGNPTNLSLGFTYLYPGTYTQFNKWDPESPVSISINKIDVSSATPITVGTEVTVTADQLYSVELTENNSYQLNTTEEWLYFYLSAMNGGMSLDKQTAYTCWTTGTYYFVADRDVTFTIVTVVE